MPAHSHYMQRAIALASKASGRVTPNPLVGCVVANNNRIVGEGYHHAAGQPHAEVEALNDAGTAALGATLYVTLEPCSHDGKTPPCTDAIIRAGIKRVVFAVSDPNPPAAGGAGLLREHGIETIQGVEENQARHLARFFLHHTTTGQPYVIAKYASSLDGKIACSTGHSQWITGALARQRSHELRQAVDGIVIGAQTAITDKPSLTVRLPETTIAPQHVRHPLRILLDSTGRVPPDNTLFAMQDSAATMVVTTEKMSTGHEQTLRDLGVSVLRVSMGEASKQVCVTSMLIALGEQGIQSLMIEGGQAVLGAFMDKQHINETWAFFAPKFIGGADAPGPIGGTGISTMSEASSLHNIVHEQLGADWLVRGNNHYPRGTA